MSKIRIPSHQSASYDVPVTKVYEKFSSLSVRPNTPYDHVLVFRKPTLSDPTDVALNAMKKEREYKNKLMRMKLMHPDWGARIVHRRRRCSLNRLLASVTEPVYRYQFNPLKIK